MADITAKITRKSLKAKKKAAIKTIKTQAKEKIREVKILYAENPELQKSKEYEREQKRALRMQKRNAHLAYNERQPRQYTLGEDIFNSISHGVGAGLSVAAMVLLIIRAYSHAPTPAVRPLYVTSFTIFASTLFIMYMMSTMYHALAPYTARKVFSILSHDSIYMLIAGTYTPFALVHIGGFNGWIVFGIIWGVSIILISLYSVYGATVKSLAFFSYLVLGWFFMGTFVFYRASHPLSRLTCTMLISGGIAYSIGAVFYLMRRHKWTHSIFHLFVLAGSILQFFGVFYSI